MLRLLRRPPPHRQAGRGGRAARVSHVVVIGGTLAESERAAALARAQAGLSATAGLHPHEARTWSPELAARLRDLLALPEVVALERRALTTITTIRRATRSA